MIVILDPKIVSFLLDGAVVDVFYQYYRKYKLVLDSLANEMLRRYGIHGCPGRVLLIPNSEMPYILLVVEEIDRQLPRRDFS